MTSTTTDKNKHTKHLMLALCLTTLSPLSAHAQTDASNLQLYGQATAGLSYRNNIKDRGTLTDVANNQLAASFIGIRETENLGGGNSVIVRLEAGLNIETGSPTNAGRFWNRQSFVALNFGPDVTLSLGRQFHAGADRAIQSLDVFNLGGTSLLNTPLGLFGVNRYSGNDTRVDSSAKLRIRGPAGVTAGLSVGLSEESGRSVSADIAQITPSYVLAAYAVRFRAPSGVTSTGERPVHEVWGAGGQLPLGNFRLYLHYLNSTLDATTAAGRTQTNRILVPAISYQVNNNLLLKAAYTRDVGNDLNGVVARDGSKDTTVLTAEYFLSKRTSVNLVLSNNQFANGYIQEAVNIAAMGRDPTASSMQGVSFGMRHDF